MRPDSDEPHARLLDRGDGTEAGALGEVGSEKGTGTGSDVPTSAPPVKGVLKLKEPAMAAAVRN